MENALQKLNSTILLCENLADLECCLHNHNLEKAGQAVFRKCGFFITQEVSYSFIGEDIDNHRISINLSKKSFIENNNWAWAKIDIVKSYNTKNLSSYKIFISDELWAEIDNNENYIIPCIHMSDEDIFKSLNNQLEKTYKLVKKLVEIDLSKECPIEHILTDPDVYFNLAIDLKDKYPVYFDWILFACEKDTILLKNLKDFILKDAQDQDLSIKIKLSLTDRIDKLLLKNDLKNTLEQKNKIKLKKI